MIHKEEPRFSFNFCFFLPFHRVCSTRLIDAFRIPGIEFANNTRKTHMNRNVPKPFSSDKKSERFTLFDRENIYTGLLTFQLYWKIKKDYNDIQRACYAWLSGWWKVFSYQSLKWSNMESVVTRDVAILDRLLRLPRPNHTKCYDIYWMNATFFVFFAALPNWKKVFRKLRTDFLIKLCGVHWNLTWLFAMFKVSNTNFSYVLSRSSNSLMPFQFVSFKSTIFFRQWEFLFWFIISIKKQLTTPRMKKMGENVRQQNMYELPLCLKEWERVIVMRYVMPLIILF